MSNEIRIINGDVRCSMGSGKAMRVSGMAARYDSPTKIGARAGKFIEVIRRGAFRSSLAAKQDTAFLINHDPSRLMARVSAGTLRLKETDEGLLFDADFPDTEEARTAYASIARGDMHDMSFGFDPDVDADWDAETDPEDRSKRIARRSIRNFKRVLDVSAVTYPAYPNTSVHARSAVIEQRSEIVIPEQFIVEPSEEETASFIVERRRRLLDLAIL